MFSPVIRLKDHTYTPSLSQYCTTLLRVCKGNAKNLPRFLIFCKKAKYTNRMGGTMKKIVLTGGGKRGTRRSQPRPSAPVAGALRRALPRHGRRGKNAFLPPTGIPFYTISAVKLVRGSVTKNLLLPVRLLQSVPRASGDRARPSSRERDTVRPLPRRIPIRISIVLAAKKLGIPVLTHESDLTPGLANRLIARRCRAVLTAFPETAQRLKKRKVYGFARAAGTV